MGLSCGFIPISWHQLCVGGLLWFVKRKGWWWLLGLFVGIRLVLSLCGSEATRTWQSFLSFLTSLWIFVDESFWQGLLLACPIDRSGG